MTAMASDFDVRNEAEFAKVVPTDAKVEKLAGELRFTEGPVWMEQDGGYLLFSDIPANKILKWTAAGGLTTFRSPSNNSNGNTRDRQGRLVTCEHSARRVTRTEADGSVTVLVEQYQEKKLNSPNDVVVKSDGTIWFTDPPYGLPRGQPKEQAGNYVYRLDPASGSLTVLASDFDMPNGLCFSPDESKLYIADSGKPKQVRVFDISRDGSLSGGRVFCTLDKGVPDGMRVDRDGRLFCTAGDGVRVYLPDGTHVGTVLTPQPAANCCFGGTDGRTLFITAQTGVYAVKLAGAK